METTKKPTQKPITIVFMGDSITEGQYVHHSLRWTELVAFQTRMKLSTLIDTDSLYFFNRGVSGETTRQGLERFPNHVQVLEPHVMTLQFGLNDCNCWDSDRGLPRVSELAYRANLIEMIDRAKRFGTKHIVLSTNHPTLRLRPLASGGTLEERRVVYNEIVREVAEVCQVTLCDIDQAFSGVPQDELAELLLPAPDVLHLSQQGHQLYADTISPFVLNSICQLVQEPENA